MQSCFAASADTFGLPLNEIGPRITMCSDQRFAVTNVAFASWLTLGVTSLLLIAQARGEENIKLPPPTDVQIDFARDVEPVLHQRCIRCHGPDKQESGFRVDVRKRLLSGGDFGEPAVLPGKSADSHLIRLVAGADPDFVMPPEGERLSAAAVGLLRAWIDQGLEMPRAGGEAELTTDHWSFQPVVRHKPPAIDDDWIRNPVDAFVLRRLRERGLAPGGPAEPAALVRRLYLDMLGLLPTPDAVERFAADPSPHAYRRLVEKVLASPHYGERWARHWLDVVRFAESNGFETNYERPNAYHYRDWVIRAFNDDMPYDRFVFAQLAGDRIGEDVATGFLVGGPYDRVKSPDPALTAMQRQDELADMINTTGTAFLGLTLGCARCHNHKFDPVLQKDYYSLQAVFAGVQHGERQLPLPPDEETERIAKANSIADEIDRLGSQLAVLEPEPFAGKLVLIDDEDPQRTTLLAGKRGHGVNPPGKERGAKDDPGGAGRLPNVSSGRYTWWDNRPGADMLAYRPRSSGKWRLWISWGCGWHTHTTDAQYVLDIDGDAATQDDQHVIATVNQQLFGDGSGKPVSQPLWSGFFDAGVHELAADSAILVRGGQHGEAITGDVIVLEETGPSLQGETARTAPRLLPPVNARLNEERFPAVEARFVRFTVEACNTHEPCLDELEVWTAGEKPVNAALASSGATATSSGDYQGNPKHRLAHVNDGQYGNDRSWISGTSGRGWVQIELAEQATIDRIVWGRDRKEQYQDRLATRYRIEVAAKPGNWQNVASDKRRVPFGLGPAEASVYRTISLSSEDALAASRIAERIAALEQDREELNRRPMAYAGNFVQPPATHRLYRGDPLAQRERVAPDTLVVLHEPVGSLELTVDAEEQQRRIALANWISSPENPLTARVIVNRLWHYHFGQGIVATPSDFGAMGAAPTHPELLDWLASELIASDWSLKHIHRLILLSGAYRQSSAPRQEALAKDRNAALLWRFPPRRLEAEAIRDNILLVSGALDKRMGGPGFMVFHPNSNYSRNWIAKDEFGPAEFRRMIYALKLRMEHDAVFGAFDCPDGGQVASRRSRSTTPIQALNLFNSNFIVQQAERTARRIRRDAGGDAPAQVRRLYQLSLGRAPMEAESSEAAELVQRHGLAALCRALFNTNEFLFLP